MKQAFFYFIFLLLLAVGIGGCAKQASLNSPEDSLQPNDKEEEVITIPRHGVCRMNLQRVSNAQVVEIANNMVKSDIPLVRINGVVTDESIEGVIHKINVFAQKGIKVVLMQPMWMDMFPEGYQRVPGPNFEVYRMSDINLDRFQRFMDKFLKQLDLHTPKGAIIGLELFNEANWADFNGDLQPTPDGKGEIFRLDTPLDKPSFQDGYAGINQYGKCLEITRRLINNHFGDRNVKLITQGMKSGGEQNNFNFAINNGLTVVSADMFMTLLQGKHPDQTDKTNYLQFANGIGMHAYPELVEDMEGALRTYYFDVINNVLDDPMPYWITEWGFRRGLFENNGGEAKRLTYFRSFIQAVETIGETEMTALFDFDLNQQHRIWENGALLESGKIFQEINR